MGIVDEDILGYLDAMTPLFVRKMRSDIGLVDSVYDLEITEAGFRLIGRGEGANAEEAPKILTWSASFAGTFAGSFLRSLAPIGAADLLSVFAN